MHLSTWTSQTCQTVTNAVLRTPQEQHSLDGFRGTIWGQPNGIDCPRHNILILCARFPETKVFPCPDAGDLADNVSHPSALQNRQHTLFITLSKVLLEKVEFDLDAFMGDHMI